jgi:major membrane immunogen (membrane-anchored lipoprotein)
MKKLMKKMAVLLLSMMLVTTLLAGCGKELVTAESLLENMRSELYTSFDMDMTMSLKMTTKVDAGVLGSLSMDVETYLDANMKCDLDTSLTSGEMTMKMIGFNYSVPVTTYIQLDADKMTEYSQTQKDGPWYYTVNKDINYKTLLENAEMLNNIDASLLQNLTLAEPTEEKADYVVTATIAFKDMVDVMGTDMQELIESMGSVSEDLTDYYNSLVYDVTYVFDGESQILESAKVVLNIGELNENNVVSITELIMECSYNQWNDIVVEVPAEVIQKATELPLGENN